MKTIALALALASIAPTAAPAEGPPPARPPVKVIFDTDIGNDVDDALAIGVLHALQTRGFCEILAITVTKPDELAGPFVDALNTFYGRPSIPIGCIRGPSDPDHGRFLGLAEKRDGNGLRFPHDLASGKEAPSATALLRKILAAQPDRGVVIVQVGYFSNCAALLDTPPDEHSPLTGRELIQKKVEFLSVMAGSFETINDNNHYLEYNVIKDIPAARKLAGEWPTPIIWSGFEIGIALAYPAISIERDFNYVPHHPLAEAYFLYQPPPHDRPTWDLTSALYAVCADRGYFNLSQPGTVTVEPDGFTRFAPGKNGRDRFLKLDARQLAKTREALVHLASQPPSAPPQ